jgi:superfamily II DNA/RNA helicase
MLAHLTDTAGVAGLCAGVKVLILDEADRLLDMGFKR